jgi:hypothetical protein
MKSVIVSTIIIGILLCIGCSPKPKATLLQEEAAKMARTYSDNIVVKCGESYYTKSTSEFAGSPLIDILELKDFHWEITDESESMGKADQMNGVEWRGLAKTTCSAWRRFLSKEKGWSDWFDKGCGLDLKLKLEKRNGSWQLSRTDGLHSQLNKVDCADASK